MKNYTEIQVRQIIDNLFDIAKKNGDFDYVCTLLRVEGITSKDIFSEIESDLSAEKSESNLDTYNKLLSRLLPLEILWNLLNCISSEQYELVPFRKLYKGEFLSREIPSSIEVAKLLIDRAKVDEFHELAELLELCYPNSLHALYSDNCFQKIPDGFLSSSILCREFIVELLEKLTLERKSHIGTQQFYKWQRFSVLKLHIDSVVGLYGFSVYFSNGSSAKFTRFEGKTYCSNIEIRENIGFFVGMSDKLVDEYKVSDVPLYEIGLPGRYNKLGEWKPIIYPGSTDNLHKKVIELTNDQQVQGALFYIFCTCHKVIEFVIKGNIELPEQWNSVGDKIHIWSCEKNSQDSQNVRIYDGWIEVDSLDVDEIRRAISTIAVLVNRISFTFGSNLDWRIKYPMVMSSDSVAKPTKVDLEILNKYLLDFPDSDDSVVLDAAFDWYRRGRNARNPMLQFFCFYVAVESVATAVINKKADLGFKITKDNKTARKQERRECIEEKYNNLYKEDPIKFVEKSYFECITSINKNVRKVIEEVFGFKHRFVNALFEKGEWDYSLSQIRGKIAHGGFSLLDDDTEKLLEERLGEMEEITREFLKRVTFKLKIDDNLPVWSGSHTVQLISHDPRNTLVASSEDMFPIKDWRIKEEWCD